MCYRYVKRTTKHATTKAMKIFILNWTLKMEKEPLQPCMMKKEN